MSKNEAVELTKQRANARRRVSKWLNLVLANLGEDISVEDVQEVFDELAEYEDQLGVDGKEEEYSSKIWRIVEKIRNNSNLHQQPPITTSIIHHSHSDIPLEPFDGTPCGFYQFIATFESKYEQSGAYSTVDQFLAFKKLIGSERAEMIRDLFPNSEGLRVAKKRMAELFDTPSKVRKYVERKFSKIPDLININNYFQLNKFIISCEESLNALRYSNPSEQYINELFFRTITH